MKFKEVKIGGQQRPVSFGTNALAAFFDSEGLTLGDLNKLGETLTLTSSLKLFYFGFIDGYRKAGREVDFNELDIGDWLDDEPGGMQSGIEKLMKFVQDSFPAPQELEPKQKKRPARKRVIKAKPQK